MRHEPASADEIETRIDAAYTLLMRGMSKRDARRYIVEKTEWGKTVERRMIYYYLERAEKQIAEMATDGTVNRQAEFAKAVTRLHYQYMKADTLNDTARAIQAQSAINSLLRLDEPQANMTWEQSITVENPNRLREAVTLLLTVAQHAPEAFERLYATIQTEAQAIQPKVTYVLPDQSD